MTFIMVLPMGIVLSLDKRKERDSLTFPIVV